MIAEPLSIGAFDPRWSRADWWLAEQMLRDIDQIFAVGGVPYFLAYGSFLGARRHAGVIPWDDDIDLGIPARDEPALTACRPTLERLGYALTLWRTTWRDRPIAYYKIWIASRPAATGLPYSWPFVDVFVFRPTGQPGEVSDGDFIGPASWLTDCVRYPFGPLALPAPRSDAFLRHCYGPDYMDRCRSGYWNHRYENGVEEVELPSEWLKAQGRFQPVHEQNGLGSDTVPRHEPATTLADTDHHWHLYPPAGERIGINATMALIWRLADGERTVREMADLLAATYQRPLIEMLDDVLGALQPLQTAGALRFD